MINMSILKLTEEQRQEILMAHLKYVRSLLWEQGLEYAFAIYLRVVRVSLPEDCVTYYFKWERSTTG
jgi:hypothetical protein